MTYIKSLWQNTYLIETYKYLIHLPLRFKGTRGWGAGGPAKTFEFVCFLDMIQPNISSFRDGLICLSSPNGCQDMVAGVRAGLTR